MSRLRHFIRARRFGALLTFCVAYALAIQALMASVGVGMSAFAAPGQSGFVICTYAADHAPSPAGDPQKQNPAPRCPFCFVGAQSVGHIALPGAAPAVPTYAGTPAAAIYDRIAEAAFVPQFRRGAGGPRAPPVATV